MNTVKVRNLEIGTGAPKIIVPIVGVTKEEILAEAKTFDTLPIHVVEWRVDWFEHVFETEQVIDVLKDLREVLGDTPILMTVRTSKEGGEKAITPEAYAELNLKAAKSTILTRHPQNQTSSTVCARCRIWALIFRRSQSCRRISATCLHCFPLPKRW